MATNVDEAIRESARATLSLHGRAAAYRIWEDEADAASIEDPRHPDFATGLMDGLHDAMRDAPGVIKRMVGRAAAAAEDLNVEPYQGIVEVLQNADDLGATEVRFALTVDEEVPKLLIVHNGAPVTCHHVLPMVLPYLTTKTDDAEQKGRFGIGLKTLRRIASRVTVHSAPYHFGADGLAVLSVDPASAIEHFYDPASDTLLVLDLTRQFDPAELESWFAAFDDENLLFLESVQRFAWVHLESATARHRTVAAGAWKSIGSDGISIETRTVTATDGRWQVFRAKVPRPEGIDRSHKATGDTVAISIALPSHDHMSGLFIGFRTRIPVALPFSIDAQFDPSTAREGLIDNPWNRWLIERCGDVLSVLGKTYFALTPQQAWPFIVLPNERIGLSEDRWPHDAFAAAFGALRTNIAESAELVVEGGGRVRLSELAYESGVLEGFLEASDLRLLRPDGTAVSPTLRDGSKRWRAVLDALEIASIVGVAELARGFAERLFDGRSLAWWIEASDRLTAHHTPNALFATPFWRSDRGEAISVAEKGKTARPLLIGEPLSAFARRWSLFHRLDDRYAESAAGKRALAWLQAEASVTSLVDAGDELAAFAEAYKDRPVEIDDADLRVIRDRFDLLTDRKAGPLGPSVGAALLLDGFVYQSGKRLETKLSPVTAYLSRTLDNDHPFWPEAAGSLPDILWLASSYDERLKTGATRASRKRADGIISRGPRKFLILLGAACSPRVEPVGRRDWGGPMRTQALLALGAEYVKADYVSPDLERVLASFKRLPKKDRKPRSAALLKALARYWEGYADKMTTAAYHMAIKYEYQKGLVDADWLVRLRETEWVAVGVGELTRPDRAVVRTTQTQTLYAAKNFIAGIGSDDLRGGLPVALKLITDVRASDLVALLEAMRIEPAGIDADRIHQSYRALARMCPANTAWNAKVDDLTLHQLRLRFSAGAGLIWVSRPDGQGGNWRRPAELLTGRDIFHDPDRFVPGGPSFSALWTALGVERPGLDDCLPFLRELGTRPYSVATEAVLIDVYRHVEPLLPKADRRQRNALRLVPVGTAQGWHAQRPIFHVADRELRERLAVARPDLRFWTPPCDVHALPNLCAALGLTNTQPRLVAPDDANADVRGDAMALRFRACVDHLANELARNNPAARDRISIPWSSLRTLPLAVHDRPFEVRVFDPLLSTRPIVVQMEAVLDPEVPRLTITEDAIPQRNRGGRAIAGLFASDARHGIEAEWVASWVASMGAAVERMTMASDEALEQALADRAAAAKIAPTSKIKVTPPASRMPKAAPPRKLKSVHGGVASVVVVKGSPPKAAPPSIPLAQTPPGPPSSPPSSSSPRGPVEYDRVDLEQRGWEILREILNGSDAPEITDFRKRHHVGADGAIDWKTFVELKATGQGSQSSVELSATEYERAREKGLDFMLALVSGLEEGETTEVRLILDPVNRTGVRPIGSVRLVGLAEASAIVLRLSDHPQEEADSGLAA